MSDTPAQCGQVLPTGRVCKRAPWWPGGRCPQHGFGAETIEQWVRGLAIADNLPWRAWMHVSADGIDDDGIRCSLDMLEREDARIVVTVLLYRSRGTLLWAKHLAIDEAAVLGDKLEAAGIGGPNAPQPLGHFVSGLRKATAQAMRASVRLCGGEQAASDAALALRAHGFEAFATADMIVLSAAEATRLLAARSS